MTADDVFLTVAGILVAIAAIAFFAKHGSALPLLGAAVICGIIGIGAYLLGSSDDDGGDPNSTPSEPLTSSSSAPTPSTRPTTTPFTTTMPIPTARTYQVSMETWTRLGPYLYQVGGRPFTAAEVVAGSNGEVTVEDSTCTSMTLRAGLEDATGGRTGSSTITVQGESDTWGSMTVESGVPAIEGGPFAIEPGVVQLSVRGSPDLTVVFNGQLTCSTPDGRR